MLIIFLSWPYYSILISQYQLKNKLLCGQHALLALHSKVYIILKIILHSAKKMYK